MFSSPSAYWPHTPAFEQERKRRGRGQEHSRWINAPRPAAHVLGKQGRGLREGSLFIFFCVCFFLFLSFVDVFVPLCSLLFWFLSWSFHVVRCRSPCVIFVFPFFMFFCMRTRSRQWLHYSFYYYCLSFVVGRFYSSIFISRVRTMLFIVVFPPSFCCPFLVIFLCPFCLLQSCLLPPFFCVCFKKKRFVSMSVCVLCLIVWSV